MEQLRHLQLKSNFGEIEGDLRLERIINLQTLSRVKAGKWMESCSGNLTNLRKLGLLLGRRADVEVFYDSIVKLGSLHSLSVSVGVQYPNRRTFVLSVSPYSHLLKLSIGKELKTQGLLIPPLSHLLKLSKLRLEGFVEKLPESTEFPTNLTKLILECTFLKQDPLVTLEKLKNLRILRLLSHSYWGKEMSCSAQGFPGLESLHLEWLHQLEEWRVEEEAMPSLLHLRIHYCGELKKLPEGLQHVTTLNKLELWKMKDEFKERLGEDGGEDWHKIRHVPSIDIT